MEDNGYKYLQIKRWDDYLEKWEKELPNMSSEDANKVIAIMEQVRLQTELLVNEIMLN